MQLFIEGKPVQLENTKMISNRKDALSIASTAVIGQTFYFSNLNVTDAPGRFANGATFLVLTYSFNANESIFMEAQATQWENANPQIIAIY